MRDCSIDDWPDAELIQATSPLLILGASVRAAAQSARRCGWQELILFDQFQDRDLPNGHRGARLTSLDLPPDPPSAVADARAWMYTGALENRPDVVECISRSVPLLGCRRASLLGVRDPGQLVEVLRTAGLPYADIRVQPGADLPEGMWVCKPRASAAGRGIRFLGNPQGSHAETCAHGVVPAKESLPLIARSVAKKSTASPCGGSPEGADPAVFYQRYVRGTSCSGAFLAARGTARLLGVTQQLIGDRRFGAGGFQYAGSIGPMALTAQQSAQWRQIGQTLSSAFGLQGLFGVDAVDTGDQIVPVEVNPRYTASMELAERGRRWPIVGWHARACREGWLPAEPLSEADFCCGKAIVFAVQACEWSARCDRCIDAWSEPDAWPSVADIPPIGTPLSPGAPILTILARGGTLPDVSDQLADLAARIWDVLHRS